MLLLEMRRPSIFGTIHTKFNQLAGGWIKIERKCEFEDGPYRGKHFYKEIFLTPNEFEELRNIEIEDEASVLFESNSR